MSSPLIADLNQRIVRARDFLAMVRHNYFLMQQAYHETIAMQELQIENISRSIGAGNGMLESVRASLVDIMSDVRVLWIRLIGNQRRIVEYSQECLNQLVEIRDMEVESV